MARGVRNRAAAAKSRVKLKTLVVSSEWPSPQRPRDVPFLVEQVDRLRCAGVHVEIFSFRGKANPLRYAAAWRRLRAEHDLRSFDLVHAHFGQSGLVALPCPAPLVVTFHGSDLEGLPGTDGKPTLAGRLLRAVSRFVARFADRLIVVSPSLLKYLPSGLEADVIPCGIDLQLFQPVPKLHARGELGYDDTETLILFVGNPQNPTKNLQLAQKAVAILDETLAPRLVVLHDQPHERVPLFMSACDVMIMTSHHEGSPTAVKEALACNLPVVSVPVGDVSNMISGVDGCSIANTREPSEIARAIEMAVQGAAATSRRNAAEPYDHSVITQLILDVYGNVAKES
jgi:teichuronic acid biosynthesis glycosyltransferase TuaC